MDNKNNNPELKALEDELAQQQAHMNAAMARWLGLLAEYDRGFDGDTDSFEGWVARRFGVCYWEAAELVRGARALAEGAPSVGITQPSSKSARIVAIARARRSRR